MDALSALLFLLLAWLLVKLAKGVWTCGLAHALGFSYQWRVGPDRWAVVTGGTDGIGLAYARQLADKGLSVMLVARSEDKLRSVQSELQAKGQTCEYVVADFARPDVYEEIGKRVASLPHIEILVNNVGLSYCTPEPYSRILATNAASFVQDLLHVNVLSVAEMTRLVVGKMEAEGRGVIVNVSSLSAVYPTPLLSLYGASKTFVDMFSRSLQHEYEGVLLVQSVLPSYVATKMSKVRRATLMCPTPEAYVRAALRTIGVERATYGFWTHKLQAFVMDVAAALLGSWFVARLAKAQLAALNRAYYRKHGDKKAE